MEIIADLHLHSKYSRAVSQEMILSEMARWAKLKGIEIIGTGDFTHPLWFREIKSQLKSLDNGLFMLKDGASLKDQTLFLLSTEISSIYSQGGKLRRIHNLVWAPSIETVEKINGELTKRGCNLLSDGRPIVGITSRDLVEIILGIDPSCLVIPAHAWTPWFSLYGSESGFDSLEECFGDMSKYIFAIETGLSSSPAMNWRIGELDFRSIVSFSDAHSGPKLGREATVFQLPVSSFQLPTGNNISYIDIYKAIKNSKDAKWKISYTIEFYPEEGKYHYTGHRNCGVRQSPLETKKLGTTCPVCGKKLTVGVMHRVEQLAAIPTPLNKREIVRTEKGEVEMVTYLKGKRPPYVMFVPLAEIIAEALGGLVGSQKVQEEYLKLTTHFGSEFRALLFVPVSDIERVSGPRVAEGIKKVRSGDIIVEPGFDGEFGKVRIWGESLAELGKESQLALDF